MVVGSSNDEVSGSRVTKYDLQINPENIVDFIDMIESRYGEELNLEEEFDEQMRAQMEEDLEELSQYKENLTASVWTDGEYIYKVELAISGFEDVFDEVDRFDLVLSLVYSGFNQPLNLEEPEEYIDLEEIYSPMDMFDFNFDMDGDFFEFDDSEIEINIEDFWNEQEDWSDDGSEGEVAPSSRLR